MTQFMNKKELLYVFNHNIQLIYKTYNHLNLTSLAEKLKIPCSTLSRLLDEKNEVLPQTFTLYRIARSLGLNMDMLFTEKLSQRQLPENFPLRTYAGEDYKIKRYVCGKVGEECPESYKLYYFSTEADDGEELVQEGEMQILGNDENDYMVIAAFGLNLENKKTKHYKGYLVLAGYHVYINLETTGITGERVLILFYDQVSDNDYLGGLGIITSISRGLSRAPCSQKIIISKKPFGVAEKETILPQLLEFNNPADILKVTGEQDQEVYKLLQTM